MLDAVLDHMRSVGLLGPGEQAECNVHIRLEKILVNVLADRGRQFYLRISETADLEHEYRMAMDLAPRVGRFVARPLGFLRAPRFTCVAFEGVEFDVVTAQQLLRAAPQSRLAHELLAFLGALATGSKAEAAPSVAELVDRLEARFRHSEHQALLDAVLRATDLAALDARAPCPQHGDFVVNNLGMRPAGLLVFDWEDYGKVAIPGFDLAVLVGSLVDFEPLRLRGLKAECAGSAAGANLAWLQDACRRLDVDATGFWRVMPFHLLAFLWLKDGYSQAIRGKVARAIEGLLSDG